MSAQRMIILCCLIPLGLVSFSCGKVSLDSKKVNQTELQTTAADTTTAAQGENSSKKSGNGTPNRNNNEDTAVLPVEISGLNFAVSCEAPVVSGNEAVVKCKARKNLDRSQKAAGIRWAYQTSQGIKPSHEITVRETPQDLDHDAIYTFKAPSPEELSMLLENAQITPQVNGVAVTSLPVQIPGN
jgi:hypothetical protein